MPPRYKVSRDEILHAAFAILEERGRDAVTARSIAEKLSISPRPIYSFFPSMDKVHEALVDECAKVMQGYMTHPYTEEAFLNMGVGFVAFYREKLHVAEFMEKYWSSEGIQKVEEKVFDDFYERIKNQEHYRKITRKQLWQIYQKMSFFTYGLVMHYRTSGLNLTQEEIISLLDETGEALIVHQLWVNGGKPS
mgnify:CR=1 FL=1